MKDTIPFPWILRVTAMLVLLPGLLARAAVGLPSAAAPDLHADLWINSPPLTRADLAGKVVLVEFWTFECWNCRHVEPYVKRWHATYAKDGLLVIGVHTPEFPHEARYENVARYVRENDIRHVVAVDNAFVSWKRFGNSAWPALYLIGKDGTIRYTHIGEGAYAETEREIQRLLAESSRR